MSKYEYRRESPQEPPKVPIGCEGCIWLRDNGGRYSCPYARCVRDGWSVGK
ncbi:hypothetical protein [Tumebacillus permanentifrigoris]|uniref:Uncharacterized protein n=1 Tax=Tumebacillus permanentifrigoris TaxID=378543 RepID=A0A316D4T2_9BACL|nr:hypothetical protein [Tumebacillus permanentifrigoris]PWK05318.1 hypothetical protein C7459_12467 [Tumebacillus permanentifrigoris]